MHCDTDTSPKIHTGGFLGSAGIRIHPLLLLLAMTQVVFRGLLASVVVGHQLAHALDYRNQGWFYFIYFTHWTMMLGYAHNVRKKGISIYKAYIYMFY